MIIFRLSVPNTVYSMPRDLIHASSAALSALPKCLPGFHFVSLEQLRRRASSVLPMPLPPEVAKGITVLPEKS